jgi:hypothetical protein
VAAVIQATFSSSSQTRDPAGDIAASLAVGRYAEEPVSWVAPLSLVLIGVTRSSSAMTRQLTSSLEGS